MGFSKNGWKSCTLFVSYEVIANAKVDESEVKDQNSKAFFKIMMAERSPFVPI